MAKTLKEIFGLREMAITVPDENVPALRRAIGHAIKAGTLPHAAAAWVPRPAKGGELPAPVPAAQKLPLGVGPTDNPALKGTALNLHRGAQPGMSGKALGGWASWKAQHPDLGPGKAKATPPPIPAAALRKKEPSSLPIGKAQFAPELPKPKSANVKLGKGDPNFKPSIDWSKDSAISGEFPDLPEPPSANVPTSNDDYRSPFGNLGLGRMASSWDEVPDWARDDEKMPRPGGGSMKIPRSPEENPNIGSKPGKLPKTRPTQSPVGAQWQDKKPGMLSRLFGKKGSK
jgi:hypothetical protein